MRNIPCICLTFLLSSITLLGGGCPPDPIDSDSDGVPDLVDECPLDPDKRSEGICGCHHPDVDTDGDGVPDCVDECAEDPNKVIPGECGCGVAETLDCRREAPDRDGDGVPDHRDGCPDDPNKSEPGVCGCGIPDSPGCGHGEPDRDGDGVPDDEDGCPDDPNKSEPGVCGCGIPDSPGCGHGEPDRDGDGVPDDEDGCPDDPSKSGPGVCGCGIPDSPGCGHGESDRDGDGVPDDQDGCPDDPSKSEPGVCGCGTPDSPGCGLEEPDRDGDGVPDDQDACPDDANKTEPGHCGCGTAEDDNDGDGVPDCVDNCPQIPNAGQSDRDGDGVGDACAGCGESGLVAYYPFDGDALDASGNGNDGATYGGASYVGGVDGQGIRLDGATGYIDLVENTNLDGFDQFTITLWIKPGRVLDAATPRQDILYKGRPIQNGASFDLSYGDVSGALTTNMHGTRWFDESRVVYDASFDAEAWFMVALTYDGDSAVRMYVNAEEVGVTTTSGMNGALFDNTSVLTVGRRPDGRYYFDGAIDELRIYNCNMSAEQVIDLYREHQPGGAGLVAHYPFDGDVIDATGNGNDGVAHGGVTYTNGVAGQSIKLNGTTGYVDLIENTNLDGFDQFTISLWIKPDRALDLAAPRQDILYKGRPVQNGASFDLNFGDTKGALTTHIHGARWFDESHVTYDANLRAQTWYMVTLTYDGVSSVRMYVNAEDVGNATATGMKGALFDNSSALTVGRRPDGRYYFAGAVDDLRIYNHHLSAQQVTDVYREY